MPSIRNNNRYENSVFLPDWKQKEKIWIT